MPARRYAVIDIGSNAVRLLVGVRNGAGDFLPELFTRAPLALGRGGFAVRRIAAGDLRRLLQALTAFRLLIDSMRPVARWRAVATAALREAENRDDVLRAIKNECGMRVHVLRGDEEAEIIGRFVAAQFPAETVLNIDTGGGSTDCALVRDDKVTFASFAVGTSRAVAADEAKRLRRWLRQATASYRSGDMVVCASGGSVRKLAELCGGGITARRLALWKRRIAALPPLVVAARYDLSPDRAGNMTAAIDIYRSVLAAVGGGSILPVRGGLGEAVARQLARGN